MSSEYIDVFKMIVTSVISGITVFLATYLKKNAEIKSLSNNIDEVKEQQLNLITATEQVKKDIEHNDWKKKERHQIKLKVLEEYYQCIDKIPSFLNETYTEAFMDIKIDDEKDVRKRADFLQAFYLPELKKEHDKLKGVFCFYDNAINDKKSGYTVSGFTVTGCINSISRECEVIKKSIIDLVHMTMYF